MKGAGPAGLALLRALVVMQALTQALDFGRWAQCEHCVAAGFGWSEKRQKCGGFQNRVCPASSDESARKAKPRPIRRLTAAQLAADEVFSAGQEPFVLLAGGAVGRQLQNWSIMTTAAAFPTANVS
eukprot:SAG31_NODE_9064_length_1341_cov_1.286634_2_plen_126_part_00